MEFASAMRVTRPIVGLLLMVLVLGGAALPAKAAPQRDVGTFNVVAPWGTTKQRWRIVNEVDLAIAQVPAHRRKKPRPKIFIATFMFDRKETATRLIRACRRGASVRVIFDSKVVNRHAQRLRKALNGDNLRDRNGNGLADRAPRRGPCGTKMSKKQEKRYKARHKKRVAKVRRTKPAHRNQMSMAKRWGGDRSYVKTCRRACRGPGYNMHSKFYVFSSTGPFRHVVKLSSSNLNRGAALKGWNDMYTMRNRRAIYRTFARMHRKMTKEQSRPRLVEKHAGRHLIRFYPTAKRGAEHDPVAKDLDKIRCRTSMGKQRRTKVLVSMFYWKGGRGGYLANRLFRLGRKGCQVKVVVGAPSIGMAQRLRKASRKRWITAYDSRWDLDGDGDVDNRTHAKFVLVKGAYAKQRKTYRVMTGSGNWVRGSLTGGDEVSLNIAGKKAYKGYVKAWDRMRYRSRVMGRW